MAPERAAKVAFKTESASATKSTESMDGHPVSEAGSSASSQSAEDSEEEMSDVDIQVQESETSSTRSSQVS